MFIKICLILILLSLLAPKFTKALIGAIIVLVIVVPLILVATHSGIAAFNKGIQQSESTHLEPTVADEIASDKGIYAPPQVATKKYDLPVLDDSHPPIIDESGKN